MGPSTPELSMRLRQPSCMLALLLMAGGAPLAAQAPAGESAKTQPETAGVDTASAAAAPDAGPTSGPAPELIAQGNALYHGSANCYACHGSKGTGSLAPSLADGEWIHSKGTYEEIVSQILQGVPQEESKSGIPMPPKGGSTISEDEVKAVAAYVFSLRQQ